MVKRKTGLYIQALFVLPLLFHQKGLFLSHHRPLAFDKRGLFHFISQTMLLPFHCHTRGLFHFTKETFLISQKRPLPFLEKNSVISQKRTFSFHKTDLLRFRKEQKKLLRWTHGHDMDMTWTWHGHDMDMTWTWHGHDMTLAGRTFPHFGSCCLKTTTFHFWNLVCLQASWHHQPMLKIANSKKQMKLNQVQVETSSWEIAERDRL